MLFRLNKPCRSCRKDRKGAAVVEFALVAPLFVAFVLGMIACGRLLMVQQILINASREGARRAVVEGANDATVEQFVREYLNTSSVNADLVSVNIDGPDANGAVTASVRVPAKDVSWLPLPNYIAGDLTLGGVTTMREESPDF